MCLSTLCTSRLWTTDGIKDPCSVLTRGTALGTLMALIAILFWKNIYSHFYLKAREREKELFHLLVHPLNVYNSWYFGQAGARNQELSPCTWTAGAQAPEPWSVDSTLTGSETESRTRTWTHVLWESQGPSYLLSLALVFHPHSNFSSCFFFYLLLLPHQGAKGI